MPATVWKGYVSFGLVSFPVKLFAAARPETVHFHMLHQKDLSRLKEVFYCMEEDKPVERGEIVKGYEYEKGSYVVIEAADLEKIAPPTATMMEIVQFVKNSEVDPIFLEKSYYVAPEEEISKPYSLLAKAMTATGYDAVAKIAMHGREHIVILRATPRGLVLHTMYFLDELHEANQVKVNEKDYSKQELALAQKLIETLAAPFQPAQFHDEYRKNVESMIERKRKGEKIKAVSQPKINAVVNIMEALQKSLGQAGPSSPKDRDGKGGAAARSSRKTARKKSAA